MALHSALHVAPHAVTPMAVSFPAVLCPVAVPLVSPPNGLLCLHSSSQLNCYDTIYLAKMEELPCARRCRIRGTAVNKPSGFLQCNVYAL